MKKINKIISKFAIFTNYGYQNNDDQIEKEDVINNLPPEILQIIFMELNLTDLGNCLKTCVRWKQIIDSSFKDKGDQIVSQICQMSQKRQCHKS